MDNITKDTRIGDIIKDNFATIFVLKRFGMNCGNCEARYNEPLENCARAHHVDLDELINALKQRTK